MKSFYLIFLSAILISCDAPENSETNTESTTELKDTVVSETPLVEEVELFNMNPEPDNFQYGPESSLMMPTVKYYEGLIGDIPISIRLNKGSYGSGYEGVYMYENNGAWFDIKTEISYGQDTIEMIIKDDSSRVSERIIAAANEGASILTGVWYKDSTELSFKAEEVVKNPVSTQLYVNLSRMGEYYNTNDGIMMTMSPMGETKFNSFSGGMSMGSSYDFGQEWSNSDDILFWDDSTLVFVETELNNSEGTRFKEGHEPSGPDCEDCIVEGMNYDMVGSIKYKVIEKGVTVEKEIELEKNGCYEAWLFDSYLLFKQIITGDRPDEQNVDPSFIYVWESKSKTFVIQ